MTMLTRSMANLSCLVCMAWSWASVEAQELKPSDKVEGWGVVADPAGDCKFTRDDGKLTITVPGTRNPHNLNPEPEYDNVLAPRVLLEMDGDVGIEVKVAAFPRPKANTSSTKQGQSYVAGGLLLWLDDKTFIRCLRAAMGERGDLFVHVEAFKNGKKQTIQFEPVKGRLPDRATSLRVERHKDEFIFSISYDDKKWIRLATLNGFEVPAKLKGGVAVINATTTEISIQFEDLKVADTN